MIIEKQIELLLLYTLINGFGNPIKFNGVEYDREKMIKRFNELTTEFLEPYTIK